MSHTGKNILILLIEDNPLDARLIRDNLFDFSGDESNSPQSTPLELVLRDTLSSGLDFLAHNDVDVILLDLNLPESIGFDTFSKVYEKCKERPIIILTGLSDREMAVRAVREGAQDFLDKGAANGVLLRRSISYSIERKKSEKILKKAQSNLERKVRERTLDLKERYDEIEQLVYVISNDLIQPLVTVKGFLGILKKDVSSNNRIRIEIDLGLIGDSIDRMESILARSLELSSIGKISNPRERVPFGDLVKEAVSQSSQIIKSSGAEIKVGKTFPVVDVDRPRIVDVLVNLIEHSINCSIIGKPLKIEIGSLSNSDGTILFVKDDGVGMDPSLQRRIFEPFYRDRDGKGSSMGLALSRRIIEVHGGRMWIESELDKGCAIFFTLPVVEETA